jgi:COMPASS component SWD2
LEFSNDGKSLLLGTDYHGHYILDAYEGTIKAFLAGKGGSSGRAAPVSTTGKPLGQGDACFSPDGRFVVGGNGEQAGMLIWDINQATGDNVTVHPTVKLPYSKPTAMVEWNPRYNMIASADKEIVFWTPEDNSKSAEK